MWTRNNDVSNQNMLKHFIYLSSSKSTTSLLCSLYYRYSLKLFSFFCILSFLVIAISIDQTFYSATHYLAAVWLNSRHDFNIQKESFSIWSINVASFKMLLNRSKKNKIKVFALQYSVQFERFKRLFNQWNCSEFERY